jgi:hypothetical protein
LDDLLGEVFNEDGSTRLFDLQPRGGSVDTELPEERAKVLHSEENIAALEAFIASRKDELRSGMKNRSAPYVPLTEEPKVDRKA